MPGTALAGQPLVVCEKLDGANCGLGFGPGGRPLLQSRGHYLVGGPRERQFDLLKQWASLHAPALRAALGERYLLYGEWLYARHTLYYDRLPHYLLVFDAFDRRTATFLDTPRRQALLAGLPLADAPLLHAGRLPSVEALLALLGPSGAISPEAPARLREAAAARGADPDLALRQADLSGRMEGLYVKVEAGGIVQARCKWVRASFRDTVQASGSHWLDRAILPNRLAPGVDIFAPAAAATEEDLQGSERGA